MNKIETQQSYNQTQIYKQQQQQEEALIEYYVYQDLQNLINLLYSRKAIHEYFQDDPTNPLVILSNNKVILQLNLSSGIHTDLQYQYQYKNELKNKLKNEKSIALQTLKYVAQELMNQGGTQNQHQDPTKDYLNQFIQNYEDEMFHLNQFQLQSTNYVPQFNEQVLSKIISSIQVVDHQTNQVRQNGTYQKPTQQQLLDRAYVYFHMTNQKLNQINPQNNQTQLNNKQEICFQGQQDNIINIANPQQFTSSNDHNTQDQTKFKINNEQTNLFSFFQFLGYFNQTGTQQVFDREITSLYNQVFQTINYPKNENYPEIQFARYLYSKGYLRHQIILHYYFQLFVDYQYTRRYQELQTNLITELVSNNKGTIDEGFYSYQYNQKILIEKFILKKTQMNQTQNIPNREVDIKQEILDYIWQMYQSYLNQYYKPQKN
ncbi:unnamed protein product [Paramecium pentaurelia]|uniref:Uncharacterized protein n=1 Tax=Paramecium pentaurelia TaxID=43138 RepID=A0A8S1WW56_9CILI|nr:unnamed protein product [Paramecium pentaurelia]